MAMYRATHGYKAAGQNQLSFNKGELFVLQGECGNGWYSVKKGNAVGLVPSSYMELTVDKDNSNIGSSFVVLYDFSAQAAYQLSVKAKEKVSLIDKHTKEWWSVCNQQGIKGLVPSSYLTVDNEAKKELQVTSEVLLSVDRAIEKIHNDATINGGQYTSQQRAMLQQLVSHRQSVIKEQGIKEATPTDGTSFSAVQSRRKAPLPPDTKIDSLDLAGVERREIAQTHTKARPKSDIYTLTSQVPSPPKRHDSLSKNKDTLVKTSDNTVVKQSDKLIVKLSDTKNDDNQSVSSDGSDVGGISPNTTRRINSYLNRAGTGTGTGMGLETVEETKIELPTEFPPELGIELIDVVRERTGISHGKSAIAVEGILNHISEKVPVISPVMNALLEALQKSQLEGQTATAAIDNNKDLIRLKEILFEIQEARDDSQQRGWAIRDDSGVLASFLEELLQLLYDSDPDISCAAIQEDKYENVLVLVSYYQLEHRVPLRIILLKIFGALITLDGHVISVLLQTVLPNELGHSIQQNIEDTEKVVWSALICTMMFSTAEQLPFSVYDQWNGEFIHILLDNIENPPDTDIDEEISDAFINTLLSFNQHFEDPATNLVMRVLKENSNPKMFSEKLMLLVNRGEDPVSVKTPCCPDSLTKILLDLFSDKDTAGIFYTSDLMVLIDIISRQLHDLCPGEKLRSHYLELLHRLLSSTDYCDHKHRQDDLIVCLRRITKEEETDSKPDQEAIRQIWQAFPGVLDSTD